VKTLSNQTPIEVFPQKVNKTSSSRLLLFSPRRK
jgi:hypothetical protein